MIRYLFLCLLLVSPVFGQSLGRLPGTIYPADRGIRTWATLDSINTARQGKPLEWYFDGQWLITANFAFQTNDVIHMLPGATFDIQAQKTLSFNGAEFWATKQRCFTGAGTTDGKAKYPHMFPEWSAGANYAMPAGYLDPPYAYSNVYSSINYTNLAGDTNLQAQLWYIDNHIGDWAKQGYVDTNFVDSRIGSYSNYVHGQLTNMANGLTNLAVQIGALGTNKVVVIAESSADTTMSTAGTFYQITFGTEVVDTHSAFNGTTFTAPGAGNYLIASTVYLSHTDIGTSTARSMMSVYKNGSLHAYLGRQNDHQGGSASILNGSLILSLALGDTVSIYSHTDGAIANCKALAGESWITISSQ